jgi:hypothetical protein
MRETSWRRKVLQQLRRVNVYVEMRKVWHTESDWNKLLRRLWLKNRLVIRVIICSQDSG